MGSDKVPAICSAEIFSHALLQHSSLGLCYNAERPRGDMVAVCEALSHSHLYNTLVETAGLKGVTEVTGLNTTTKIS